MLWRAKGSLWALLGFAIVATLVVGGLAWVTRVALAMERDQARIESD